MNDTLLIAGLLVGLLLYTVIGFFISGLLDNDDIPVMIMFWPLYIIVILPIDFAFKLGQKVRGWFV